jgi:uncharacterized protein YbbK (DUF523 family)
VSSCLLGEPVRYDGDHKRNACVTDLLSAHFDCAAVCPEVGIGMGVPRPPVRLVKQDGRIFAKGVEDARVDVTARLQRYAQQISNQLSGVSGYIFKSRSPSCGLNDTDLFDAGGELIGKTGGVFSSMIHDLLPDLPLIDEVNLDDPAAREAFVQYVYDYWERRQGGG